MFFECFGLCVVFTADSTSVRFVTSVRAKMLLQVVSPSKRLLTDVALVGLLSCMNACVKQKLVGKCKLLATDGTREIFLAGMDAEVCTHCLLYTSPSPRD